MNLYFLVEGKTEQKVYPEWIKHLAPRLQRVAFPQDAKNDHYYLISGGGYPSILDNHLANSILDVNDSGNYDYLVLVIDADASTAEEKKQEVDDFLARKKVLLRNTRLVIIPQVACMETWFLGNRRIYARQSSNPVCLAYSQYYDVSREDPEHMVVPPDREGITIGQYHFGYLKAMLQAKNVSYNKSTPREVQEAHYLTELRNRLQANHDQLHSLRTLFRFLGGIHGDPGV